MLYDLEPFLHMLLVFVKMGEPHGSPKYGAKVPQIVALVGNLCYIRGEKCKIGYARPLSIRFQYSQGSTYFFSTHMDQRGTLWSNGNVILGLLE